MKFRKPLALITAVFLIASSVMTVLAADWDLEQQGSLHIDTNTDYHVTSTDGNGNSVTTSNTITVADNVTTNITLDNVNINSSETGIDVGSGADVTLNIVGDNSVYTNTVENKAAIHVSDGNLTITSNSSGTLAAITDTPEEENEATGGENDSAAIGSDTREDMSGNITINGNVNVYASSRDDGAGIGSGDSGSVSGNITISGNAKVEALSGDNGAGIGTGEWDFYDYIYDEQTGTYTYYDEDGNAVTPSVMGGNITIDGNAQVVAESDDDGAGIGSGESSAMTGKITITGNTKVWAESEDRGAGIGSGESRNLDGSIIISGNSNVTALSDDNSAGIGAGQKGTISKNGNITIEGNAKVLAIGDGTGAGIGSGGYITGEEAEAEAVIKPTSMTGNITIRGNTSVTAIAGSSGTAIGAGKQNKAAGSIKIMDNAKVTTGVNGDDEASCDRGDVFQIPDIIYTVDPNAIGVIGASSTVEYGTDGTYYIGINTIINGIPCWDVENLGKLITLGNDLSKLVLVSNNEELTNCRIIRNETKDISAIVSGDKIPTKLVEEALKDSALTKDIAADKILRSCHLSFDKDYTKSFILRFHLGEELAGKTVEILHAHDGKMESKTVTVSASGMAAITTNTLGDFAVIAK